jgi:molybdopterin molybdotransferase
MGRAPLLPVAEALKRILAAAAPVSAETLPLMAARGRTLAADLASRRTQPPFATTAMDGYAVRGADVMQAGARLAVIGESAAGRGFAGTVRPGEAVRIFTGAPLPDGADTILIQENAVVEGAAIVASQAEPTGRFVRRAGLDFSEGDTLLRAGQRLGARELGLAAAMNHASVSVRRRPRIGILATGDELVMPGETPGPDQIIASNNLAVAAAAEAAGGEAVLYGIAGDSMAALETAIAHARADRVDVLVTIGGASVGDHDLVQAALANEGMDLGFWRIAMRPGKPLMFGTIGDMILLGLPGNPVSSLVCSLIFLRPLIRALVGDPDAAAPQDVAAIAGCDFAANDERQDYLRATVTGSRDGVPEVIVAGRQDSSMLATLARADCLLIRPPHAPAARAGSPCRILWLGLMDR